MDHDGEEGERSSHQRTMGELEERCAMIKTRIADIYVTKWWAAKGIILVHGAEISQFEDGHEIASWGQTASAHKGEYFETYQEACARVETLAVLKITSLETSIRKIHKIATAARQIKLTVTSWPTVKWEKQK